MTDQFKWEGNVLRGPFKHLIDNKLDLPRGPPESAPFNTGQWSLSIRREGNGFNLYEYWTPETVRAEDVNLCWGVSNESDLKNPPDPISETVHVKFDHPLALWNVSDEAADWNVDEHVAAGSEFRMTVDCPSLARQVGKPVATITATYFMSK